MPDYPQDLTDLSDGLEYSGLADKSFQDSDLDSGHAMTLLGVFPGSFSVIDQTGVLTDVRQVEVWDDGSFAGTRLEFGNAIQGIWRLRFLRGPRGPAGSVDYLQAGSLDDRLKCAMLFG